MSIFRKKRKQEPEAAPIRSPCEIFGHTWKDFPPYLEYNYRQGEECNIKIIESYVCICCKQRVNETIGQRTIISFSRDSFFKEVNCIKNKYKKFLKPRAIVEDMIHDAIYVDREKLEAWERLHGNTTQEKKEFELKLPGEEYGIRVLRERNE